MSNHKQEVDKNFRQDHFPAGHSISPTSDGKHSWFSQIIFTERTKKIYSYFDLSLYKSLVESEQ